jgi:peptide-methionine (S)-S-oxide reductase
MLRSSKPQYLFGPIIAIVLAFFSFGCMPDNSLADPMPQATAVANSNYKTATFAGGCFWCMEKPFDEVEGVVSTISGYTGGQQANPTYRQVSSGTTGHAESVQITYDPKKVKYKTLLDIFWRNIDPLDAQGQFCDKGSQYRSAIFYADDEQQKLAEQSKAKLAKSGKLNGPIVTEITSATTFYPAEDYHQNFYQTNSVKYKVYRFGCGRDQRLKQLWGAAAGH